MSNTPVELRQSNLPDLACPHRFHELHILGTPEPDGDESTCGNVLHELAKLYGRWMWRNRGYLDRNGYTRREAICGAFLQMLTRKHDLSVADADYCEAVGGTFARGFKIRGGYDHWYFEKRMAVDRDFRQCKPVPRGTRPRRDSFGGTPDVVAVSDGGRAFLGEYKMGEGRRAATEGKAVDSLQLRCYAMLIFIHYPHVAIIDAEMWFPRFGVDDRLSCEFRRESLLAEMREYLDGKWALVDFYRETYGGGEWPLPAGGGCSACTWCKLACPAPEYAAIYEGLPWPEDLT